MPDMTAMTAEQVLNCPFCEQQPSISATGSGGIKIECRRCGLTMRRRIPHHYPEHWTRERIVARWNNRPGAARLSGMAADTWQPIETAPKDRRVALWIPGLFSNTGRPTHGEWDPQKHHTRPRPFWRFDLFGRESDMRAQQPTHWREPSASPEPPHV